MNYLDIKGGKPKYKIDVKKEKWSKIIKLLSEINLLDYEIDANENKGYGYSITYFFKDSTSKTHTTQNEKALENLKAIIQLIRNTPPRSAAFVILPGTFGNAAGLDNRNVK
jgi:hypothetical protein